MDFSSQWPVIQPFVSSTIRHVMGGIGGYLAGMGAIQATQSAEFTEMGTGIVLFALAQGWSFYQKNGANIRLAVMAKMHPVVGPNATMAESVRVATKVADAG